jgi:hypothetical protein
MRITLDPDSKVEVADAGNGIKLLRFTEQQSGLEVVIALQGDTRRRVRDALTLVEVGHSLPRERPLS